MSAPRGHRFYGNQYKKAGGGGRSSSRPAGGARNPATRGRPPSYVTRKGANAGARARAKVAGYKAQLRLGGWSPKRRAMLKAKAGITTRTNVGSKYYKAKRGTGGRIGSGVNPYARGKKGKVVSLPKRKGSYATGKLHSKSALPGRVGSIHAGTRRGASKLNQGQRVSLGKSRARRARKAA